MEIVGYKFETKQYLVHLNGSVVTRYYEDIKRLDRMQKRTGHAICDGKNDCIDFPLARFKKLSKYSWEVKSGVGYQVELKKSLMIVNEWLNSAISFITSFLEYQDNIEQLEEFINEERYHLYRQQLTLRCQNERRKRELQQYFTLSDNIETLIKTTFEYLSISSTLPSIVNDCLFIEPSCGDGRIIQSLIAKGCKNIIGYEIDGDIVKSIENLEVKSKISVQDFTGIGKMLLAHAYKNIILIGNPPFADQRKYRHYPLEFILQGINHYNVTFVAFILPVRCRFSSFTDELLDQIHTRSSSTWQIINIFDVDSSFEFNHRVITQPSILLTLGAI